MHLSIKYWNYSVINPKWNTGQRTVVRGFVPVAYILNKDQTILSQENVKKD